ncbi:MAG: YggS family pyridoxal phosphate-dependent enzyme [Syntrophales bacterium]|nr:YggS family pyridoxal phosphate-dependent enzyme [Syntrophales bacterium]
MERTVKANIEKIRSNIAEAALRTGRHASEIRLMAVTKTVDENHIMEAIEAGVDIIGENYVQEAKRKMEKLGKPIEWHMIGHLQTNKAKYAVGLFDMIHSLDRMDLAIELDRRSKASGHLTKVLIEVNISGEKTKNGVSPKEAIDLIRNVATLENLLVYGLMTMPPWFDDPEKTRPYFVALRKLRDRIIEEQIERVEMRELSMGMSVDYRVAVEEGATIVRIGRDIFGERIPVL